MVGGKIQLRKYEKSSPENWISDNKLVVFDTDRHWMANFVTKIRHHQLANLSPDLGRVMVLSETLSDKSTRINFYGRRSRLQTAGAATPVKTAIASIKTFVYPARPEHHRSATTCCLHQFELALHLTLTLTLP